ncbi:hypothetical protein RF55_11685 [Lasius niger]|uniref:Uncharacterized protein n=1 Tax=Lasius niger TaxID=67767 RepID=A0A0J7KEZ2_LASNI|nr:hypothetical protein RF55_11685 [Lasius niger]
MENLNINIAALCETRLDNHILPSLANYDIHTSNCNRYGGGVAIIVWKEFRLTYIKEDHIEQLCTRNEIELLVGKIWIEKDKHLYVCSIYSPPRDGNHPYTDWRDILHYCINFDPRLLFVETLTTKVPSGHNTFKDQTLRVGNWKPPSIVLTFAASTE